MRVRNKENNTNDKTFRIINLCFLGAIYGGLVLMFILFLYLILNITGTQYLAISVIISVGIFFACIIEYKVGGLMEHSQHSQYGKIYKNNLNFLNHNNYYGSKKKHKLFLAHITLLYIRKIYFYIVLYVSYIIFTFLLLGYEKFINNFWFIHIPIALLIFIFVFSGVFFLQGLKNKKLLYGSLNPKYYHKDQDKIFFY